MGIGIPYGAASCMVLYWHGFECIQRLNITQAISYTIRKYKMELDIKVLKRVYFCVALTFIYS